MTEIAKILIVEKYTGLESVQNHLDIGGESMINLEDLKKFHEAHQNVKNILQKLLEEKNLEYNLVKIDLIENIDLKKYKYIISLGGDGTFLGAVKKIKDQIVIGINSELDRSVGHLTSFNIKNLHLIPEKILSEEKEILYWERLAVKINGKELDFLALNEVFIGHVKIYKTSHLDVSVNEKESYFSGNGLVVSTFKGSTAFYKSAGGTAFEEGNYGFSSLLTYRIVGDLEKNMVLDYETILKIKPKRLGQSLIFDADEGRELKLEQEDIIEIYLNKKNCLKVLV